MSGKPEAYAARLNDAKNRAAESRKKKKKKKREAACPGGSVHGLAQPCTECNSVWCRSK
jgi:hypothetical protein